MGTCNKPPFTAWIQVAHLRKNPLCFLQCMTFHDKFRAAALRPALLGMQAKVRAMSAAHASALSALTERLDGASASITCLEEQLRSGRGELAEMEARVRSLHHELQVSRKMHLSVSEGQRR